MFSRISTKRTGTRVVINSFLLIVIVLIAFLWSSLAHSFSYVPCKGRPQHYKGGVANMYISTSSFPAGSVADSRLQRAMWHWNNVRGSSFKFQFGRDTDGLHRLGNGYNEIYLDNDLPGNFVAATRLRYQCYWAFGWRYGILETDIEFNLQSWNTDSINYDSPVSPDSFEGVALHELGHALGLGHENRTLATMNERTPNGGPIGHAKVWDVLPDDRNGVRFLYPDSQSEIDIAGSAFVNRSWGSARVVNGSRSANRGDSVTVEYTVLNLGTISLNYNVGFYLSTNDYITSYDRLLGTTAVNAPAGSASTLTRTVNIPTNVTPGNYWIGFVVDYDSRISERSESNNTMEVPRRISIN